MKLKLDENGHVVVQDGKPVYVHDDGKEVAFDAPQTVATITRLNGEAKSHREAKEKLEEQTKAFEGLDPVKVKEALNTVQNLDAKKLVDAGEVDKVKAEITDALKKTYEPQIQQLTTERDAVQQQLHSELIGGGFARSKFIQDNIAVPVDMIQATFGKNFKIEEGKVVAVGADGQKIYSRARPGEVADFDEALETLVGGYQHKDSILKGGQGSGGGFQGSGQGGGAKTMSRQQFDALDPVGRSQFAREGGQIQ
ncbi:DUF6651 domain-containing protein [Acinetobacter sp. WCHAc060007]|uniref:DUF6651 domain-containing protein n=1 Tax=Acinetobacter sp. WCHAc060007 TaxID=2419605 RepID=UPI000EA40427|nr:DUF6651 domain-containing protein [Acinetobacter sp. WCHAc060007]RKG37888.1 hypothetical protein D7V31_16060 [Acinetobacter sp. WCHAc060007]